MYQNRSPNFELTELEAALRQLTPAEPELNREKLMFLAGQASVRPRRPLLWQGVSGVLAAVTCILCFLLVRGPRTSDAIVQTDLPIQAGAIVEVQPQRTRDAAFVQPPDVNVRPTSLAMRWVALQHGVDALPSYVPDSARHEYIPTNRELLREMVPRSEQASLGFSITPWHWQQVLFSGDAT